MAEDDHGLNRPCPTSGAIARVPESISPWLPVPPAGWLGRVYLRSPSTHNQQRSRLPQ
ncbi:hypothetical protein [Leptodesmis sp.]|uniref:hypothetical protein n=1 Tax=Leptodesmis sp. TaxID=3100501 RepID=UPI0040535A67